MSLTTAAKGVVRSRLRSSVRVSKKREESGQLVVKRGVSLENIINFEVLIRVKF